MFQVFTAAFFGLMQAAGRAAQTIFLNDGHWTIQNVGGKTLRVYVQIVQPFTDIAKAVVNATEFQRESAVSIVWDPATKRILVVEIERPVIPESNIPAWRAAWSAHIDGPVRDVVAFGHAMAGILGFRHWQLTQSYGYAPETIEDTARRAAEDQGGMHVTELRRLQCAYSDASNRADPVSYYLATVDVTKEPERWAKMQQKPKIGKTRWVTEAELLALGAAGDIPTAFAHSAFFYLKANGIL